MRKLSIIIGLLALSSCASVPINNTKVIDTPPIAIPTPAPLSLTPFKFDVISNTAQLNAVMKSNNTNELYSLTPDSVQILLVDLQQYQSYIQEQNIEIGTSNAYYNPQAPVTSK